jgi:2'-5' RNA ligase
VSAEGIRAFIALELGAEVRRRIADLVSKLRPRYHGVRWVRPEAVHLTLRFLGDSTPEQVARVERSLDALAPARPPSDGRIRGLGVFAARGSPRVLWLGLEVADDVRDLQADCERAAIEAGFPPESRPYAAHLTLGRWRGGPARMPELPPVDLGSTRLDTVVLMRSDLGPGGASYTVLASFPLSGSVGSSSET